jgi:hypothetical protein
MEHQSHRYPLCCSHCCRLVARDNPVLQVPIHPQASLTWIRESPRHGARTLVSIRRTAQLTCHYNHSILMRPKGTLLPLVVVPFHPRLWRTMTTALQPSLQPVSACHLRPLLVTPVSIRHPFRNGAVSLKCWPLLVAWTTVSSTAATMTGYWTRPRRCRRSRALTGREIVSSLKDARLFHRVQGPGFGYVGHSVTRKHPLLG